MAENFLIFHTVPNLRFFSQQAQREDSNSKESSSKDASKADPKGAANNSEPSISDDEEEMETDDTKPKCSNCGILCHVTHATSKGNLCGTCHQYWVRTGQLRPTTGPARKGKKVKLSLVISTTFEYSRQKQDTKLLENGTF